MKNYIGTNDKANKAKERVMADLQKPINSITAIMVIGVVVALLVGFAVFSGGLSKDSVQISWKGMQYAGLFSGLCVLVAGFLLFKRGPGEKPMDGMIIAAKVFSALTVGGVGMMAGYLGVYAMVSAQTENEQVANYRVEHIYVKKPQRSGNSALQCTYTAYFKVSGEWMFACADKRITDAFNSKKEITAQATTITHPSGLGVKNVSTILSVK